MKRVLVTGATGFIGRHCLPLLQSDNYEVHAISSKAITNTRSELQWHQVNLLDQDAVVQLVAQVKPTHLLHLAWYAVPRHYWSSAENFSWVGASLQLLQSFVQHGGERVTIAGTCAEYDWTDGYCSEKNTKLLPTTLYGTCKHALRLLVEAYCRQINLSAAWGRIFYLYGPHEHPERLVPSVVRSLLRNEPARCSHGEQQRDFLFVEDVAGALVALLSSTVTGPVNIGSGKAVALKDVILQIAAKLGRSELVQLGALPAAANDPPLLLADIGRIEKEVGWSPQFDLNQGLERTIEWWRQSAPGND